MSTPHKCPVCDGSGQVPSQFTTSTQANCSACNGSGIVWDTPEPSVRLAPSDPLNQLLDGLIDVFSQDIHAA